MAELVTIARPYAEAVFRIAQGDAAHGNAFADWSRMLQVAAAVAQDAQMTALIASPNVAAADVARVFLGVCDTELSEQGKNFVKTLIENDRLSVLPQVAALYEELKRSHQNEVEAVITSALPLTDAQVQELVSGLEKRFGHKVKATTEVDAGLIGGARIAVGDVVIDGSVTGQLAKMATALKS
jgi:F-type H+-transporting ATPase subunit delta